MKTNLLNKMDDFVYQRLIKSFMFNSRLGRKSTHGLADSGINFDHIYLNQPKGYNKIGLIIDRILLNLPACQATRNRYKRILSILKSEIDDNRAKGNSTKIVDLASGPARYIVESIPDNSSDIECLCLDIDHRSLNFGKKIALGKPVLYRRANVLLLGDHLKRLSNKKEWRPNVILASGFYEYQNDHAVKSHFDQLIDYLGFGGLFVGIFQYRNPNRKLIEKVGKQKNGNEWKLYYRTPEDLRKWVFQAGFTDIRVELDNWNQYVFCLGRKP